MNFKVKEMSTGFKYDCYGFITGGNGTIYGVCYHKGDKGFMLIPYSEIKPVEDKTLNENNATKF